MIEDSEITYKDLKIHFEPEIINYLRILNKNDSFWGILKNYSLDKLEIKAVKYLSIFKNPSLPTIIKCADKLDNLRDITEIPTTNEFIERITYWILEAKFLVLPFAKIYCLNIFNVLEKEIASKEAIFIKNDNQLFDNYSIRLNKAINIWSKIKENTSSSSVNIPFNTSNS